MVRGFWCVAILSVAGISIIAREAQQAAPTNREILNRYCVGCHNARAKAGDLALDGIDADHPAANPDVWEKVVRKLRPRYMPPAGSRRPDERTYDALISSLEASLDQAAAARPNPGRTDTFRRLNRTEYQNVIHDLLDIDIDVTSLLPADEISHGFDNIIVGDLSPMLLERYMNAAQKISHAAVGLPIASPGGELIQLPPDFTQEEHVEGLPLGTRGGTIVHHTFPLDAEYEIVLRLTRDRNEHVEGLGRDSHQIDLILDGERVELFTITPPPPDKDHQKVDEHLRIRIPVKAGPHEIAVAFVKQRSAIPETERQPYPAHFNMDRHPRIQPALFSISINGPFHATGSGNTPSRRRLFVCRPTAASEEDACARRILTTLMRRAYRRPVTDDDLQRPLKFYRDARQQGDFDSGIEMALNAVLVSPEFLFHIERDPEGVAPNTAYRIGDVALASRLSFFLWSSSPDDELLDLAIRGTLSTPRVLDQQVRRMLKDPRSAALVNSFADQWLRLRNLATITPDMRLFAGFDDNLRQAFRKETELFFESIMREDRNILDLLRADYTFVNERLARHYGIKGIYGSRFRRVTFNNDVDAAHRRGGLLRHGSFLMVSSYATRTSPVLRGKWILDNLLGLPPPPPLPVVPALKENRETGRKLSVRERLSEHRDNPACSGCHKLMDPIGFTLENYDAVGRWRTTEDDTAIDATGGLPDGSTFEGVAGLQNALLNRPEVFATTFTDKLLTYALGRGVEPYDAPAVRKIVRNAQAKDFRFSSIILGIVDSAPFRMRKSQ